MSIKQCTIEADGNFISLAGIWSSNKVLDFQPEVKVSDKKSKDCHSQQASSFGGQLILELSERPSPTIIFIPVPDC